MIPDSSYLKRRAERLHIIIDDEDSYNQTVVCYIPDRQYLSGEIVSTTRSNLNLNKFLVLLFSPRANTASIKGTMLGY